MLPSNLLSLGLSTELQAYCFGGEEWVELRILATAKFLDVNKMFMSPKQDQERKAFSSYDNFPLDIKMRSVGVGP